MRDLFSIPTFGLCALLVSGAAEAQVGGEKGPLRSGVLGRIVVSPEMLSQSTWPLDEERAKEARGVSRIRRPAGRGKVDTLSEPTPELFAVLEGARTEHVPKRELIVAGKRFVPAQLLVPRPGEFEVENRQSMPITIVDGRGEALASVMPGERAQVTLQQGEHGLSIRELPFAQARVRVIGSALFIPWSARGEITPQSVESGEYELAFYHGAKALRAQPLVVPDTGYVAIDATVSANGVVTVSLKDGTLHVAAPPPPPPPATPDGAVSEDN